MCLCVAFAQLSLYSSIWDANVGLIIGSGAPNGVKFDVTNPDKITKIAKSYHLRQEFQCTPPPQVYAFISFVYFLVISSSSSCLIHEYWGVQLGSI